MKNRCTVMLGGIPVIFFVLYSYSYVTGRAPNKGKESKRLRANYYHRSP